MQVSLKTRSNRDLRHPADQTSSGLRRGTATVEFAVTAPLFLILLLGLIEMSRALDVSQRLSMAVREGGRAAASELRGQVPVGWTLNQKIIADVRNMLVAGGINANDLTITITHAEGDNSGQTFDLSNANNSLAYFRVTVSVPYEKVALLPARQLQGKTLRVSAVFRAGRSTLAS